MQSSFHPRLHYFQVGVSLDPAKQTTSLQIHKLPSLQSFRQRAKENLTPVAKTIQHPFC